MDTRGGVLGIIHWAETLKKDQRKMLRKLHLSRFPGSSQDFPRGEGGSGRGEDRLHSCTAATRPHIPDKWKKIDGKKM